MVECYHTNQQALDVFKWMHENSIEFTTSWEVEQMVNYVLDHQLDTRYSELMGTRQIMYNLYFKNEQDEMLFKLTWG